MARARAGEGAPRAPRDLSVRSTGSGLITSTHLGHSVLPMRSAIGAAEAVAVADAAGDGQLVLFELHAGAAPVAELAPREVGLDRVARDRDAGGQTLHDGDEFGAVRFAGREHAEHWPSLPRRHPASRRAPHPRHRAEHPDRRRRRCEPAGVPDAAASRAPSAPPRRLAATLRTAGSASGRTRRREQTAGFGESLGCGIRDARVARKRRDREEHRAVSGGGERHGKGPRRRAPRPASASGATAVGAPRDDLDVGERRARRGRRALMRGRAGADDARIVDRPDAGLS